MYPSHSNSNENTNDNPLTFHFPSPNIHYEDDAIFLQHLHDLVHHQQHHQQEPICNNNNNLVAETVTNTNMTDSAKKKKSHISNKKSSKKDRHSKINTARGPRDRRMRLSLDVARKFFGLQDILGFDKASKTVEWLLTKSKPAIKEHINNSNVGAANSASSISTSDCEVLSGLYESTSITFINGTCKVPKPSCLKEKKMSGFRSKPELFHPHAREMRDKARARARERTKEKMRKVGEKSKVITCTQEVNNVNECSGLGSWTQFENREEESVSQIGNTINHSFQTSSNWSPSTFFGGQHNPQISHQNQFVDLQVCGKPWDAYNN